MVELIGQQLILSDGMYSYDDLNDYSTDFNIHVFTDGK